MIREWKLRGAIGMESDRSLRLSIRNYTNIIFTFNNVEHIIAADFTRFSAERVKTIRVINSMEVEVHFDFPDSPREKYEFLEYTSALIAKGVLL